MSGWMLVKVLVFLAVTQQGQSGRQKRDENSGSLDSGSNSHGVGAGHPMPTWGHNPHLGLGVNPQPQPVPSMPSWFSSQQQGHARYPQLQTGLGVHPQPLPAPSLAGSSESRDHSGEMTGRYNPPLRTGQAAGDSHDMDSGGGQVPVLIPRVGGYDSDSNERVDSIEEGYVYYHPPARPACPSVADVIIMLDGSDSLTEANFNTGKQVTDQIISRLYLNPESGYVAGALVFSDSIQEIRLRPFKDNVYLRSLVLNTFQEMGGTGTDYALYNMRRLFFAEGRSGVPRIGVLMTDGRARNPSSAIEQARMAKMEGIHLIAVAVGVVTNARELQAIASSPRAVVLNPTANAVLRMVQSYASTRCARFPVVNTQRPLFPGVTIPPPRTINPGVPPRVTFPPQNTPRPVTPFPPRAGPCDNCKFVNGIGYNPHESVCSYYYQCFNNNGVLTPVQRECAFGLFWDQMDLTCKIAAAVDCATDPCKRSPQSYGVANNCRAYWQCRWGRTLSAQCCAFSHRFNRLQGCVFDNTCTVTCPPRQPVRPGVCNKRPYPQDRTQYYEDIDQGPPILRRCAPGTAFVPAPVCRCDQTVVQPPTPWACKPDLYFPFNTDLLDKSDQRTPTFVDRVTVDRTPGNGAVGGGAARFNGNGKILVWRYANMEFGSSFVIRLRYRALAAMNDSQTEGIVTNSDCREPCSIAVSYNRQLNTTNAKIRTENSGIVRSLLSHSPGWNDVEYRYDGSRLTFSVNGNTQTVSATGNIAKVPAALQIGTGCMGYAPFTGLIDELYVYKCIP